MKNATKIILLTAGICTVAGGALAGIAIAKGGTYQRETIETVTYSVKDSFTEVSIATSDANITILPSENGSCYAQCDETESMHYTMEVKDNKLYLEEQDERKLDFYFGIGIMLKEREVVLYLPTDIAEGYTLRAETASGDIRCEEDFPVFPSMALLTASGNVSLSSPADVVAISTSSGNIRFRGQECSRAGIGTSSGEITLKNIKSDDLTLHTTSGDIDCSDGDCIRAEISTSSGEVTLANMDFGDLTVQSTSGDISATRCDTKQNADAAECKMAFQSNSGEIEVSVLSPMRFSAESTSGDIDIPPSSDAGGELRAKSTSGDITIRVLE